MQAILKKWKPLIYIGFVLVILAYVTGPIVEFTIHVVQKKNESDSTVNPHWRLFTNNECGFVASFPSRPFIHPQVLNNYQNVISYHQFASVLGSNVFMVATLVTSFTNDFSNKQVDLLLDKAASGALGEDGVLLANHNITIATNPGREIEFRKANKYFIKMRYYRVGHTLQELTTLEPLTNKRSTNTSYFFDSFRLISK